MEEGFVFTMKPDPLSLRASPTHVGEAAPSPSESGLRQFLQNVHGYAEAPTVWELSQLAAMVEATSEDSAEHPTKEAERRVNLAGYIWNAAARKRKAIQQDLNDTRKAFESKMPLYGPLKIGTHFLPRIEVWDDVNGIVPFKRYLEQVIGMAREEDRIRWWRAYLTAKIRGDLHAERWGYREDDEHATDPDWCPVASFPIPEGAIPRVIENQRLNGFRVGFIASYYLEEFRTWRLGMKSPDKNAEPPNLLNVAARKGLEAEISPQSENPPDSA